MVCGTVCCGKTAQRRATVATPINEPDVRPGTRKYDASRRRAGAQANRERMLAAAHALFIEKGYAGTTLSMIAEDADVALPTVYSTFGNKRAILAELLEPEDQAAIALPTEVITADDRQGLMSVVDNRALLRAYAELVYDGLERSFDLLIALRVAAGGEPEAERLESEVAAHRLDSVRPLAAELWGRKATRRGLSEEVVAQSLWAMGDVQLFRMLVRDRAWPRARFSAFVANALAGALLPAD
jgi:AcrR family transcriptional regulator